MPSPFLDSGFIFPNQNYDLTIQTPIGIRRLNPVVWHLTSRGISEMGSSQGKAHDQNYLSIEEYYSLFFEGTTKEERQQRRRQEDITFKAGQNWNTDKVLENLKGKFMEMATAYQTEEKAKREKQRNS